jgi:hypothetical protein
LNQHLSECVFAIATVFPFLPPSRAPLAVSWQGALPPNDAKRLAGEANGRQEAEMNASPSPLPGSHDVIIVGSGAAGLTSYRAA